MPWMCDYSFQRKVSVQTPGDYMKEPMLETGLKIMAEIEPKIRNTSSLSLLLFLNAPKKVL